MNGLKELQKWIKSYQTINNSDPPIKSLSAKIKELLSVEKVVDKSPNPTVKKIYFRESQYSNYDFLRDHLRKDKKFVEDFYGVDLQSYIDDAMAWSEKGNVTTDTGWLLTLRKWMRDAKRQGKLILRQDIKPKEAKGHINH